MQLPRIVEGLFLGPSNYSIGLQCADLIVAMTANAERAASRSGTRISEEGSSSIRGASGNRQILDGVGLASDFPEAVPRARGSRHRLF